MQLIVNIPPYFFQRLPEMLCQMHFNTYNQDNLYFVVDIKKKKQWLQKLAKIRRGKGSLSLGKNLY